MLFLYRVYVIYILLAGIFAILGTFAWMLGMTTVTLWYIWQWIVIPTIIEIFIKLMAGANRWVSEHDYTDRW